MDTTTEDSETVRYMRTIFPSRDESALLRELRDLFPPRWRFLVRLRKKWRDEWEVAVPARYADRKGNAGRVVVVPCADCEDRALALHFAIQKRKNGLRDLSWLAPIWPNLPTDLPWFMPWFEQGGSEYDV